MCELQVIFCSGAGVADSLVEPTAPWPARQAASSTPNFNPACACSRAISLSPIAGAVVQMPPGVAVASCSRQAAASVIILEVEP